MTFHGFRNGMRTSPIRRKNTNPRVRKENSILANSPDFDWPKRPRLVKVPSETPGIYRIAGKLWPISYMPEITPEWRGQETFHEKVGDDLHWAKWTFWHCTDPRLSDEGFPDYVAFRERIVWIELKVRNRDGKANTMSKGQRAFANRIVRGGGEFHEVLWPDDYDHFLEVIK